MDGLVDAFLAVEDVGFVAVEAGGLAVVLQAVGDGRGDRHALVGGGVEEGRAVASDAAAGGVGRALAGRVVFVRKVGDRVCAAAARVHHVPTSAVLAGCRGGCHDAVRQVGRGADGVALSRAAEVVAGVANFTGE